MRKHQVLSHPSLPGIVRVTSLKVLGVIATNGLSVSDHVRGVIIAKLLYASSAWWGLTNATDRQQVNAFLRRSIHCGLCPPDLDPFEEQCQAADEQLFDKILRTITASFTVYSIHLQLHRRTIS